MYQQGQHCALAAVRTAIHGPPGALAGLLAAALLVSACAGGNKHAVKPACINTHEEGPSLPTCPRHRRPVELV